VKLFESSKRCLAKLQVSPQTWDCTEVDMLNALVALEMSNFSWLCLNPAIDLIVSVMHAIWIEDLIDSNDQSSDLIVQADLSDLPDDQALTQSPGGQPRSPS
jgi:hypothetical protein